MILENNVKIGEDTYKIKKLHAYESIKLQFMLGKALPIEQFSELLQLRSIDKSSDPFSEFLFIIKNIVSKCDPEIVANLIKIMIDDMGCITCEDKKVDASTLEVLDIYLLIFHILKLNFSSFFLGIIQIFQNQKQLTSVI